MKFFIDENLTPALKLPLEALFYRHTFRSYKDEDLGGVKDIPLFSTLGERDFHAIITQDANQVVYNELERRALFDNGIHWIGVPRLAPSGVHLIAAWMAVLTAALPHIIDTVEGSALPPSWFKVLGIPVESAQRMKTGLLWRTYWE